MSAELVAVVPRFDFAAPAASAASACTAACVAAPSRWGQSGAPVCHWCPR